jgi:hypothetical protein
MMGDYVPIIKKCAHHQEMCPLSRNKHTKKNFAPSWLYLQDTLQRINLLFDEY